MRHSKLQVLLRPDMHIGAQHLRQKDNLLKDVLILDVTKELKSVLKVDKIVIKGIMNTKFKKERDFKLKPNYLKRRGISS